MENRILFKKCMKYLSDYKFATFLSIVLLLSDAVILVATTYCQELCINFSSNFQINSLKIVIIINVFILLIILPLSCYKSYKIECLKESIKSKISLEMVSKINLLPLEQIYKIGTGDLLNRIKSDLNIMTGDVIGFIFIFLSQLIVYSTITIYLYSKNTIIAMLSFLCSVILMLTPFIFNKLIRKVSGKVQEYASILERDRIEIFNGITEIKVNGLEKNINKVYMEHRKIYNKNFMKLCFIKEVSSIFQMILQMGWLIALIYMLARMCIEGMVGISVLYAFAILVPRMQSPLVVISQRCNNLFSGLESANRIFEILDACEKYNHDVAMDNEVNLDKKEDQDVYKIDIRDLNFKYNKKTIFNKLNLQIGEKEHIAIMGESGSGKSTLVKLILGLYKVKNGSILIEGENIKNNVEVVREKCAYISQEGYFFKGTIRENLSFGNENIGEAELIEACKIANCYEYICGLENKFDTVIMQGKDEMSGGQKQRLCIARAIVKNSDIIIFDEFTSNLDNAVSEKIVKEVTEWLKDKTAIFITHKEDILKYMDRIYEIKNQDISLISTVKEVEEYI